MGTLVFNGISSRDVGIEVETFPTYDIPEREYTAVHVPGRNGDVIIDNGTYKNVKRSYLVSIATYNVSYHQKMAAVAKWLHTASGYARLDDSYEPDFYRMAYYNSELKIENIFNEAGKATLEFICKPQKFYRDGDIPLTFTSTGRLYNHTGNIALPLIEVTTDNTQGTISVGGVSVTILANSGTSIILNTELQDAYNNQNVNKNPYIVLTDGEFPILSPGINSVTFSGGVQSVKVTPKWWTI